jgi:hypothetical protein
LHIQKHGELNTLFGIIALRTERIRRTGLWLKLKSSENSKLIE